MGQVGGSEALGSSPERSDAAQERSEESPPKGRLARDAGVVAGLTVVSRMLGLVREVVFANLFGATAALDAFLIAQTVPNLLRRLVADGALSAALVPTLTEEKTRGGVEALRRSAALVLGALIPFALMLTGLGLLFPDVIVSVVATGFEAEQAELAASLTRIMMPFVFFLSLAALAGSVLQVEGHFAPPAAAPIVLNLAIIAAAFVGSRYDEPIAGVAWGVTAGGLAQLVLQLPFLARSRLLSVPQFDIQQGQIRALMRRLGPTLLGIGGFQLNLILVRALASHLPEGQLACYNFATRLEEFALGVFAVSIGVASLPTMATRVARGDKAAFQATLIQSTCAANFFTIPSMVGLAAIAEPAVGVMFRHGAFAAKSAALTTILLQYLALGLIAVGAIRVLVSAFYALDDVRTPAIASVVSLVATGVLGWILQDAYEIQGLTMATTVAAYLQLLVLLAVLPRVIRARFSRASPEMGSQMGVGLGLGLEPGLEPGLEARGGVPAGGAFSVVEILEHGLKCFMASALPSVAAYVLLRQFSWFDGLDLGRTTVLGATVIGVALSYLALTWALGVREPRALFRAIYGRLQR